MPRVPVTRQKTLSFGLQFEQDFFGIESSELHHLILPKVSDLKLRSLHIYCNRTFQRETYGLDSQKPHTLLGRFFFSALQEKLPEKFKDKLHIFCLLGTAADRLGADATIRLRGENRQVLIDLTVNTSKVNRGDILVLQRSFFEQLLVQDKPHGFEEFTTTVVRKLLPKT